MSYFPMMVKLDDKKVLIIGGGEEGLKKTQILHEFGAEITLISKDVLKEAIGRSCAARPTTVAKCCIP